MSTPKTTIASRLMSKLLMAIEGGLYQRLVRLQQLESAEDDAPR